MQVFEKGQYSGSVTKMHDDKGILASVTNYEPHAFNGAVHYHDNAHFSFMLAGECAEKKKYSYEILPGNLIYYSAGEQHQVTNVGSVCRRINIEIEENVFAVYGISDDLARTAIAKRPDAKFLVISMYKELKVADAFSLTSVQMLLLNLISSFKPVTAHKDLPAWAKIVQEILHDRCDETISLHQLATEAHISEVNISKYFPVYFSCTLGSYMRKLKVEKSLKLIKSTTMSLTAIGHACGFADQSHFTRVFKEYTGCLPRQFRDF